MVFLLFCRILSLLSPSITFQSARPPSSYRTLRCEVHRRQRVKGQVYVSTQDGSRTWSQLALWLSSADVKHSDLAFVLDCTGSMQKYINSVRDHIIGICDLIRGEEGLNGPDDLRIAVSATRHRSATASDK